MKTPTHIKIAVITLLLAVAAQAQEEDTGPLSWESGATTVTLSDDGTLTVSGKGAMKDYFGGSGPPPWRDVSGSIDFDGAGINKLVVEDGVTSIGAWAFADNTGLTSVTIPGSVKSIGNGAFVNNAGLMSVTIEDGVKSIGSWAFSDNTVLTSVTIPRSVTAIGTLAFNGCAGLTSITVAAGNAGYRSVDGVLFNKNKTALIQYPPKRRGAYAIPCGVKTVEAGAFSGCAGLTSVKIPRSVKDMGDHAFSYCAGLTSVTVPGGVKSIGAGLFGYCTGLTSVKIPRGVAYIGDWAFDGCTGLTSVKIPRKVTNIGAYAFRGCAGLTSVTIPKNVMRMGKSAFENCTGLTSITVLNPKPPEPIHSVHSNWYFDNISVFSGINRNNACLYVPASSIAAYRDACAWKDFNCVKDLKSAPKGE